jgi:hypothetical protein
MTFSDSGCYAGYTPLPYNNGFIESPVAVDNKLVLTYWEQYGGMVCKIPFSFVPEAGATYLMRSSYTEPTKVKALGLFDAGQNTCGLVVMKKKGDVELSNRSRRSGSTRVLPASSSMRRRHNCRAKASATEGFRPSASQKPRTSRRRLSNALR